jgi:hypothetical protein
MSTPTTRLLTISFLGAVAGCAEPATDPDAPPPDPPEDNVSLPGEPAPKLACPGAIDSIKYYYPLRIGSEMHHMGYMDSPRGDDEYPGGGVGYDNTRCGPGGEGGCACPPGVDPGEASCIPSHRDYMGGLNGGYDVHNGYDITVWPDNSLDEGGGEVYAAAPGVVDAIYLSPTDESQHSIVVEHPNGYKTWYRHVERTAIQVRDGDQVDTGTVLATQHPWNGHLHFDMHDCDPVFDNSYVEPFRADKQLFARKPSYESESSDVGGIQLGRNAVPIDRAPTVQRFAPGDRVYVQAEGQWRKNDTILIEVVDSNGAVKSSTSFLRTDDWIFDWYRRDNTGYLIGAGDPTGTWWNARVSMNGTVRQIQPFWVDPSQTAIVSGPVRSAVSMVSSGTANQRIYYRDGDGRLRSHWWRDGLGVTEQVHSPTGLVSAPACVQRSATLVDCFYRGAANHLYRWASTDSGSTGVITDIFSGVNAGDPQVISAGPSSLEVTYLTGSPATTVGFLRWDGTAFIASTTSITAGTVPSCVATTATQRRCYATTLAVLGNGELLEFVVNSGVASPATTLTGYTANAPVQATLLPGRLSQAHRIELTTSVANRMQRYLRILYTSGLPTISGGLRIGAPALSVSPRCSVRPGSRAPECYGADLDGNLIRTAWTGTAWQQWHPLGWAVLDRAAPAIAQTDDGRLHAFYTTSTLAGISLRQRSATSDVWAANTSVGSHAGYATSCVGRGIKLDCFGVTSTGQLTRRTYNGGWSAASSPASPANVVGNVSAIALTASTVAVFYLNTNGDLVWHSLGDTGWSGAPVVIGTPAGTTLVDGPGCTTRFIPAVAGANAIDCYVRTAPNTLAAITKSSTGGWGAWSTIAGATPRSAPAALATNPSNNEVFFRGEDNTLVHMTRSGATWTTEFLGGAISSAPSCIARTAPARLDCVARGFRQGLTDDVVHYHFQASIGWQLPRMLGTGLTNIALGKPAFQSSEYTPNPGPASRAVDGNLDGNYNHGSVSHTSNSGTTSWLYVDLGADTWVDNVQVFNRTDAGDAVQQRLADFELYYWNTATAAWVQVDDSIPTGGTRTDPVYPATALPVRRTTRYIKVELPVWKLAVNRYLHIAELLVMGREG